MIQTLQVTIGAAPTRLIVVGASVACKWFTFQNNAAHTMRLGDSNVSSSRGLALNAQGSFYTQSGSAPGSSNLASWFVQGTQNDVLDIIYDDGQ